MMTSTFSGISTWVSSGETFHAAFREPHCFSSFRPRLQSTPSSSSQKAMSDPPAKETMFLFSRPPSSLTGDRIFLRELSSSTRYALDPQP